MLARYQVLCINKPNRSSFYEHITHLGGTANGKRWRFTREEVIQKIESGVCEFYVNQTGKETKVIVINPHSILLNKKYLKTVDDGVPENNLLNLPECPTGLLASILSS